MSHLLALVCRIWSQERCESSELAGVSSPADATHGLSPKIGQRNNVNPWQCGEESLLV